MKSFVLYLILILPINAHTSDFSHPDWGYFPIPQRNQVSTFIYPERPESRVIQKIVLTTEIAGGNILIICSRTFYTGSDLSVEKVNYIMSKDLRRVRIVYPAGHPLEHTGFRTILELPLSRDRQWTSSAGPVTYTSTVSGRETIETHMGPLDCLSVSLRVFDERTIETMNFIQYFSSGIGYVGRKVCIDGEYRWLEQLADISTPR